MATITDQFMNDKLSQTKSYSLVLLKPGANRTMRGGDAIIWEHGRRNFSLRADGLMSIVCPVPDGTDLNGIVICNAPVDQVTQIMDEDPAVKAGIFVYEIHPCRSFPGDRLP